MTLKVEHCLNKLAPVILDLTSREKTTLTTAYSSEVKPLRDELSLPEANVSLAEVWLDTLRVASEEHFDVSGEGDLACVLGGAGGQGVQSFGRLGVEDDGDQAVDVGGKVREGIPTF